MPGNPKEAGLGVEHALGLLRAELHLPQHEEDHAGIDGAAAGSHRKAVEGGEAHGRRDADAALEGTQARAVAEMGDDHPALGEARIVVFQDGRDVVVGQPVEAVAPHAALAHLARQREQARDVGLGLVEGGVEAGDLRHPRKAAAHDPDRLQVVGLMQRRERHQRFKRLDDGFVDQHRTGEGLAAMDDPMPDGHELAFLLMLAQPRDQVHQRLLVPEPVAGAPRHLVEDCPARVLDEEVRRSPQPFVEALPDEPRLRAVQHRRRPGT